MLAAGHQTTINFFTNSRLALLTHPDQLELVRAGEVSWEAVTESVLAWDSPVGQSPFRYPTQDIEIGGTLIRAGEPVMMSYAALGRDPAHHGPLAASFDAARDIRHLSFGHGPHFCVGAPLARLEAHIALPAFFDRFDAELAAPAKEVEPFPSPALTASAHFRPRSGRVRGRPPGPERPARDRPAAVVAALAAYRPRPMPAVAPSAPSRARIHCASDQST
ncbi:Cytochrome P450 [Streptomyces noursei ATCC 11455]|uniref:cytochrome P450 n=1 Tax=Streptomyces noursei TaxID=1971 RepID=UPI00081C516F|nr:Cytochrome P450 [Streptomyces noursei ATCC 11455]